VTPSPATASDGGTGWARCDIECLVQTWLSRKSAPTGSPLQEHDVGVGESLAAWHVSRRRPGKSANQTFSVTCDLARAARLCSSAKHRMREIMDHVHDFTVKYEITHAPLKSYP
jgi:hypothetical protein